MTQTQNKSKRRITLDQVWLFAAVAFVTLRVLLTPVPPHDFWWHIATGREIVATGVIPVTDSFSFTRIGEPFYNQSWLAQLLMYALYSIGGVSLLVLFQALVLVATYGLLLRLCVQRTGAIRLSVGVLLLAVMPASFDNWMIRPQTYAFPLFVGFLYILTLWRLGQLSRRWLWLLPLLMVIWVNLHGSFVLGGVLVGLTFVGEFVRRAIDRRRETSAWATQPVGTAEDVLQRPDPPRLPALRDLFLCGVFTGLAWFANPRGVGVLSYVRDLLGNSAVTGLVTEWAPPTVRDLGSAIFFLLLMFAVAVFAYARRPPDVVDMLLAGAFLWVALGAVRNIVWFVFIAAALITVQAATRLPAQRRSAYQGVPLLNSLLIGLLALLLLLTLPWIKPVLGLPPQLGAVIDVQTPVAAVQALRAESKRPTRLFHAMSYGSYLIWQAPEQPVFIDPRIELYPLAQWQDYIQLSSGRDVDELVAKYRIDGLLLSNEEQAALVAYAQGSATWELRYADDQSSLFVRR